MLLTASALVLAVPSEPDTSWLQTVPSSLDYPGSGGPAEVLLVLRNPTTQPAREITITVFPGGYQGVQIRPQTMPAQIKGGDQFAWSVQLPAELPHPIPDALRFRVDCKSGEGTNQVLRVLTAQVEIKLRKAETVEDVAKIELLSSAEGLRDGQPTTLMLSITNKSDHSLSVNSIEIPEGVYVKLSTSDPADKSYKPPKSNRLLPKVVPARSTTLIPVDVEVEKRIVPGKHPVGVTVGLEWGPKAQRSQGSVNVTREVPLSVLGESEILSALGIPSLLILPGYLVLIAFLAVYLPWSKQDQLQMWKNLTRPSLIVLALTFSFVLSFAYQMTVGMQFMFAYSWNSIMGLWFICMTIGVIGGLTVRYHDYRVASRDREQRRARTYVVGDPPIDVLNKLAANGGSWKLDFGDAAGNRVYQLPSLEESNGNIWVSSQIEVDISSKPEEPESKQLEDALEKPGDMPPAELALLLKRGLAKKLWQVRWKPGGSNGPIQIASGSFNSGGHEGFVGMA
jgi:hypothetical protein